MILTKVNLDLRLPSARQALVDCGDMHRNIQALFGECRKDAGVLYRVLKTKSGCTIYIISSRTPNFDLCTSHNGMIHAGTKDITALEKLFTEGMRFNFDLLTSPTKKEPDRTRKNSQRRILRNPEEKAKWFARKAEEGGFKILSVHDEEGETLHTKKTSGELWIHTTKFTGLLEISDSSLFINTWKNGIGPEKAYGLGMMMVR